MNKKIIFSAGGTGGHIFPAINLMNHFSNKGYETVLVTDKRGNNFISKKYSFKSYILKVDTPTNKNFIKKFLSLFVIFYSIIKSIIILKKEKPNLILGFGGYVSFPICFTSKFFKIPLVIYENNLILGRANRYLLPLTKKILLFKNIKENFPKKFNSKACEVGPILNKNIINYSNLNNEIKKNEKLSLLVLGGSQGAEIFGKIVPLAIKEIKDQGFNIEVYQQCIKKQKEIISEYYKKNNIKNYIFEFDNNILKLISSSYLAITRCGASTTAELAHTITPFIAVPLEQSVDNHQYLNAKYYNQKGCCWILEEKNFTSKNLFNLILEIIKNKNKIETMRTNMRKSYNNEVYNVIENEIKEFI